MAVDDCCKRRHAARTRPGPRGQLAESEVVTFAIDARARPSESERAFHRHASRHPRAAFPGLPSRARLNRLVRACASTITACALAVGQKLECGDERAFEAIDGTGLAVRNAKRCGADPTRRCRVAVPGQVRGQFADRRGEHRFRRPRLPQLALLPGELPLPRGQLLLLLEQETEQTVPAGVVPVEHVRAYRVRDRVTTPSPQG